MTKPNQRSMASRLAAQRHIDGQALPSSVTTRHVVMISRDVRMWVA
jgi:hypothetical protein